MKIVDYIYRCFSWLKHRMFARNTLGHGIHSPYLYYLVRFVLYDNNSYYCFSDIEKERRRLLGDYKKIYVDDYGTGKSGVRKLSTIATTSLIPATDAQMLFRIVNFLKPEICFELGTNLGITTSYLSVAAGEGKVITFEGCRAILQEARKVWNKLNCENISVVEGDIDVKLDTFLTNTHKIDFALIDANHTYEATMRYFRLIASCCSENSVLVIDDIHHSLQMARAWEDICREPQVTTSIDLYDMGIIFFNKQFLPKRYRMIR